MKTLSKTFYLILLLAITLTYSAGISPVNAYDIVDTGQEKFYDANDEITSPEDGDPFYGQDAHYDGNQPSYTDNGDGTITDNVTGLMWQQSPDITGDGVIDVDDKMTYYDAVAAADTFSLAGHDDWRLPTIKELYSLIMFSGIDPSGPDPDNLVPFINTDYFDFAYGDESSGERLIDAQYATETLYVGTVFNGEQAIFGVNFADGRIKGYPTDPPPGKAEAKLFYVLYVRENSDYGINEFVDNGDGTITDNATGLMWMQTDNGEGLIWEDALSYAENLEFAGYSDWRLPDAKELQSIVDYTRSPTTTGSAAIDSLFNCTEITVEDGSTNYPFYWSGTTHANISSTPGSHGAYVAFGQAFGWMEMPPNSGNYTFMDVHGAGAQRSDPKTGDPDDYPYGFGPQGDVIRIYNYVRCVRHVGETGVGDAIDAWDTQNLAYDANDDGMVDIIDIQQLIAAGEFSFQSSNFPNPFNPDTSIQFYLPIEMPVELNIYDMTGRLINTLIDEERDAGDHSVTWHGNDESGNSLGSGMYVYAVTIDGYKEVKRMLLLK